MTVEHQLLREEVMADVDGQLAESRRAAVRSHLDGCAECRALVEEINMLSREIATDEVEAAPATLGDRARVLARARWRWSGARTAVFATAAAAVVVAALVFLPQSLKYGPERVAQMIDTRPGGGPSAGGGGRALAQRLGRGGVTDEAGRAAQQGQQANVEGTQPLVVRTASMSIVSDRFDTVRDDVEKLVRAHDGRIGEISVSGQPPSPRSLRATLRIPPARLDAALAALRQLGRVTNESAATEDVTESVRDLRVRIANSRREEQRLVELLANRTGTLKDVLEVEREIARVRGEIERMDAQERAAIDRVDLASVTLDVSESYRAELAPAGPPVGAGLRNAVVTGLVRARDSLVSFVTGFLQVGPTLALWALLLFWPARAVWRRVIIR